MMTINILSRKPQMVESIPFNSKSFDEATNAFSTALSRSNDLLGKDADVNTITVKSVDTGREVGEFMISIFSTEGSLSIVVPSDESNILAWKT